MRSSRNGLSPGVACGCFSPRSIVTWTTPAARSCVRESCSSCWPGGMDCRVLSAGVLDPERETSLDEVLATLELPARRFQAALGGGGSAGVIVPVFAGPDRTRDHAREGVGSNGRSPNLGREADDRSVRRGSPDPAVSADRTSPWSGARS
jgi:hypothetical protein